MMGKRILSLLLCAVLLCTSVIAYAAYDSKAEENETEEVMTEEEDSEEEASEAESEEAGETEETLSKPKEDEEMLRRSEAEEEEEALRKPEESEEEGVLRKEDVLGTGTESKGEDDEEEDDGEVEFDTLYFVNPEYEGIISESDLLVTEEDGSGIATLSSSHYTDSIEEAGEDVRYAMEMRESPFTIRILYPATSIDTAGLNELVWDLWEVAFEHTGVPTEGDYMRWQYGGWTVSASGSRASSSSMYLNLKFTATYYTTYEQEQAVTSMLDSVFASLNLGCKSDYERVKAIYDYICSNIVYDYDNLYDSSHLTKFSAYGALVDGKAVCQGYAVLLYRMLLTAGVDCRVVTGSGNGGAHAWNIVCLDGKYYNVDATWDAGRKNYAYFLLPDASFTSHTRGSDYSSNSFYSAYPMSSTAYDASSASAESHHTAGEWETVTEPTCTESGLRRRWCTVCGELVDEEGIKAYGHDYFSETVAATCEEDGAVFMICEHCGDTYIDSIIPGGHSYKEEIVKSPSCTEGGYSVFTCTVCGDTYEGNHKDPLGHVFTEHVDEPTCVSEGKTTNVCTRCGASYVTAITNPTGMHSYADGVCEICGRLEETEAEEHVHDFVAVSGVDSSCGVNGRWTYECSCGASETVVVPATGDHEYTLLEYVEPTCTEHGYAHYSCFFCSNAEADYSEELPAAGHSFFDAPELSVMPTCTESGVMAETCDVCGEIFEESVPATGHHSVEQEDGSWVCELCGLVTAEAPAVEESEEPQSEEPETDPEDLEPLGLYDITQAVITGIEEDYIYDGQSVDPEPVVTYDGRILTKDVDYVLVYAHDSEIGYASVSIIGIGDYYGDVTFHYMIEAVEHGDEPDILPEETESEESDQEETISTEPVDGKKDSYKEDGDEEDDGILKRGDDASANNGGSDSDNGTAAETSASSEGDTASGESESETEGETEGAKGAAPVQTSDNTPIGPTMGALFASACVLMLAIVEKKRRAES